MRRNTLALLLAFFYCCSCSNGRSNAPQGKEDEDDGNEPADVSYIAKNYEDSLRKLITPLNDITDIKTLLCQQWEHEEDKKDARTYGSGGGLAIVYRGFVFFNNGTVVQNPRGRIGFGKWQYNDADKTIAIQLTDGGTYRYKIKAVAADELKLMDMDGGSDKVITYVGQSFSYKQDNHDPFYTANNQWRTKPKKQESEAQLAKRVKDFVHFFRLFYNDNLLRDSTLISFIGLPSCFNWYNGGITVQMANNLDKSWANCFYSQAQALQARTLLENWITEKYNWTKGNYDWRVKTAKVLQQMDDRFAAR